MSTLRTIFYATVGATMFFVAGAYGGYEFASVRNTQWGWGCHTMSAETSIDVLRKLQHGDLEPAQSTLERRVDLHVYLMQDRSEILTDATARSVRDALVNVKRYRQEFPWAGNDPGINAAVVEALSKVDTTN